MVQEDRTTDQFIREVDEELRRDQLKAIWERFGVLIITVCVVVVLGTAGWRGWVWWNERIQAERGDAYLAAIADSEAGRQAEAVAAFERLGTSSGPGYAALARFQAAAAKARNGDTAGALADYDGIVANGDIDVGLRDAARVRAALLALDAGDGPGAEARVSGLAVAGNPFRHAAREILGLISYSAGDLAKSRQFFVDIQSDAESPQGLRSRAGVMVSLIDGQMTTPPAPPAS